MNKETIIWIFIIGMMPMGFLVYGIPTIKELIEGFLYSIFVIALIPVIYFLLKITFPALVYENGEQK